MRLTDARQVRNLTRKTVVVLQLRLANTPLKRLVGLLADSHLPEGHGLLITPCQQIHSIGMRFPFDAVFLDKNLTVLHTIEAMPTMRFSKLVWKAKYVLELPAGAIRQTETQIGDQLELA